MPNRLFTSLLLLLLMAACAPAQSPAPSQTTAPAEPVAAVPDSKPAVDRVPAEIGEVDYSCKVDADCAVKNVGNCCGYYPACTNIDSPTFPEQVQQRCAADGTSSICGFREISACQCVQSRCEAAPSASADLRLD